MRKILITGVSGFIGQKLTKKLRAKEQIIGFCRHKADIKNIRQINDDLLNISRYKEEFRGVKCVYHLAALINFHKNSLEESLRINVLGTKKLLETCRKIGIKKFLFVSSGARLGFAKDNHSLVNENNDYVPPKSNPYAYSKYLAEREVLKYSKYFGVVIVNPSTVYGDGDKKGNSIFLVKLVAAGKLRIFFPGGTSYIDIDDLIDGLILAMKFGRNKESYILSRENLTYRDLINRIAKVLKKGKIIFTVPRFTYSPAIAAFKIIERFLPSFKLINSNILEGFYQYRYFNTSKAGKELGLKPKYKIEDSVRKISNFYEKKIA